MYNRWSTIKKTKKTTTHHYQQYICCSWLTKMGILFGGGELLLELTVNLWFVSWWGFCCSFNLFFYFEKLHRHTLKTLFNREKHINVLPFFGWIEGKKMVNGVLRSFLPSFSCGFTLFQSPTCFPLKIAWLNIRQNKATSPFSWCHPSSCPPLSSLSSILDVVGATLFSFCFFLFFGNNSLPSSVFPICWNS